MRGSGLKPDFERRELVIDQRILQLHSRIDMHDESIEPMTVENVEEFDVWIFDSQDLVASVVHHYAPWSATTEEYEINQQSNLD